MQVGLDGQNIKMKTYIAILLLLIGINHSIYGQGKITGNIINKNQAVEFATVTIANKKDSVKIIAYETTDSLGRFTFQHLDYGVYLIRIKMIGFHSYLNTVQITPEKNEYNFENLQLLNDEAALKSVVVSVQKKSIEKTSEGFIINTNNSITQIGGTATDLLRATPTVSVDNDGVITLRGKTPMILVNGRNSSLSNPDQIAASSIESIEIINNASSKYDANAESGIINIKLKKNKQNGTNGAIAIGGGLGSKARANTSIIINNKEGKFNWGLGYDNRFAGRTRKIESYRTNYNLANNYRIEQNRNDKRVEGLQNIKLNLDFAPNEFNTISLEAIGSIESQDNNEDLLSKIANQSKLFVSANDRHSFEYEKVKNGELALNYLKTYKNSKQTINATLSSSVEKGRQNTDIFTKYLNSDLDQIGSTQTQLTHNYEDGVVSNAIVDYTNPISKFGVFEAGYKGIFRSIKTDYLTADKLNNTYVTNSIASNTFKFNEQVQAFYVQFHNTAKQIDKASDLNYSIGLRAEQVNNNGETITQSTKFKNSYLKLFPTASLLFDINPKELLKFSYGKRINRPGLGQLNPFVDITDILSPHSGNPNLSPEMIDAYEIEYNKNLSKYNFTSTVFFRHSINAIRSFYTQQPNGAILNMPMNIGTTDNYGIETMLIGKPFNFYDFNISATLFEQNINASSLFVDAVQSGMNWSGKIINNINFIKGTKLQIIGNYISPKTTPQGETFSLYNVDMAIQQKIGKSNFKLNFIIVDAFNTLRSGYKTQTSLFSVYRSQKSDTRAFMVTLAYSFKSTLKDKMLENKFNAEY